MTDSEHKYKCEFCEDSGYCFECDGDGTVDCPHCGLEIECEVCGGTGACPECREDCIETPEPC